MPNIDIYVGEDEERRKRRRGKWLIPIFVGIGAALALGREKPSASVTPSGVVSSSSRGAFDRGGRADNNADHTSRTDTSQTDTSRTDTSQTSTSQADSSTTSVPAPGHIVVTPASLNFGDGPLTRGVPAQMATIHNDGSQPLARVSAIADGPFLATNGCTEELAPGDRCMIAVVFAPKQPGQFPGSLRITAGPERAQIPLHGSVPRPREVATPPVPSPKPVPVPAVVQERPSPAPAQMPLPLPPARVLCFEPARLHFIAMGRQNITLTNPEPEPLRVIDVVPVGEHGQTISGYTIDSKKCLRVLKAGEQCKFTVLASELAVHTYEVMHLTVYYEDPATGSRRAARYGTACGNR
jgi:hypothetical protein